MAPHPPESISAGDASPEYPDGFFALFYAVVSDRHRTYNSIKLLVCLTIAGCALVYTAIAAAKGVHLHGLPLHVSAPGGLIGELGGIFGGGSLTYASVKVRSWFRRRPDAAVSVPPQSSMSSPAASNRSGRPAPRRRRGRRPRRRPQRPPMQPGPLGRPRSCRRRRTPRSSQAVGAAGASTADAAARRRSDHRIARPGWRHGTRFRSCCDHLMSGSP
jgi:hypothetical protein